MNFVLSTCAMGMLNGLTEAEGNILGSAGNNNDSSSGGGFLNSAINTVKGWFS